MKAALSLRSQPLPGTHEQTDTATPALKLLPLLLGMPLNFLDASGSNETLFYKLSPSEPWEQDGFAMAPELAQRALRDEGLWSLPQTHFSCRHILGF